VTEKTIKLHQNEEFITLQCLLKVTGIISTGGMAKVFLFENEVLVNGESENRRGRKLYNGDKIQVANKLFTIKKNDC
jgi:S4 domain protein YaaA